MFLEILDRKANHATLDILRIEELDASAFIEFVQPLYRRPIELKPQDDYRPEIDQLVDIYLLARSWPIKEFEPIFLSLPGFLRELVRF